jgi:myo-inositol-1(or 4)-monophosphatase
VLAQDSPPELMGPKTRIEDLRRIAIALHAAKEFLRSFGHQMTAKQVKENGDPVTVAERAVNDLLFRVLPRNGEGWLSEETYDDLSRIEKSRVWVVDPVDGTKEFLSGIPEWCVSIALVEDGEAVAGGICNPATGETFLGSRETGMVSCPSGSPSRPRDQWNRPVVLASRSETQSGDWDWLRDAPFEIRPVGSVAYKLALVAAGLADATWTLTPKHEWDIAGGIALLLASGGKVRKMGIEPLIFNRPQPLWEGGLSAFSGRTTRGNIQLFEKWLSTRC